MKALIQKHQGEFANISTMTAFLGFREKGYAITTFEYPELAALPLDDDCIVCGGIPVVLAALKQLGVTPPELRRFPIGLRRLPIVMSGQPLLAKSDRG